MRKISSIVRAAVIASVCLGFICLGSAHLRGAATTRPASGPATKPSADQQARVKHAKTAIAQLATALDLFKVDCGSYPTTEEGLAALQTRPADGANWHGPYIEKLVNDPWGHPYHYCCPGSHQNEFDLFSTGPDGREGGGDDITNWDQK